MESLKCILAQFGIQSQDARLEQTHQGLINSTYFVFFGKEPRFVLQRINEQVFPNTKGLLKNLEQTLPHLASKDYQQVRYHYTTGGKLFYRSESGELWRLMSYLPKSVSHHFTSDPEIAYEAGRILGVFHRNVAALVPHQLSVVLDRFHDLEWRLEQYGSALQSANPEDLERTSDLQRRIDRITRDLKKIQNVNLPIRVCHNDTKLNNILFSTDKKALCLIDLDTLMPGLLLYDFGDAVRTLANPAAEEETDLDKIGFSLEMFKAFVEGLALNRSVFTREEIHSLSLGPVYMPFLHGLRAYTDFLLGNVYYKVAYADQNLDRARSLIQFASLALEHEEQMHGFLKQRMFK